MMQNFLKTVSIFSLFLSSIYLDTDKNINFNYYTQSQLKNTEFYRLDDVSPQDWTSQALQGLNNRYGCLSGYPDGLYRGSRTLSRYEFAASLKACLEGIERLLSQTETVTQDDLTILARLVQEFETELIELETRLSDLEEQVTVLEEQQFSTTTQLNGQVIFAVNAGGFEGDRIIDPKGVVLAEEDPQATFLFRAAFDFDTSFRGTDLLKIRVDTGSNGILDNATGLLEPNFGSILDISNSPPRDDIFGLGRVYYRFKASQNLSLTVGALIEALDFIDNNRYANLSFRDFSTESLVYNYVLFPINGIGAGAIADWKPGNGNLTFRALYIAANATNPSQNDSSFVPGLKAFTQLLYSNRSGNRGLFDDFYQGMLELEYTPSSQLTFRLIYSGGEVFDERFDAVGVNFEWAISSQFALFGRYGYSSFENTDFGDINPNYWMAGLSLFSLFTEGDRTGFAVGQPFIADQVGNSTQTNFELFYNYPINDYIQISPVIQIIDDAGNQGSNGTIFTGTFRTVFEF